jgi:anaphase-promoting complex subunit 8
MVSCSFRFLLLSSYQKLPDFSAAEEQFEKILKIDPCRIDDIDVYSNILYVTENRLTLSRLAHDFLALDKDRPEVCCLVGTFWLSTSYS